MPNSVSVSAAAFIVGQSESLPIKIPTNGLSVMLAFIGNKLTILKPKVTL